MRRNDRVVKEYLGIGDCYQDKKDYAKAMEYYNKAVKTSEEAKDKNGLRDCYDVIAYYYSQRNDYGKSIEYRFKALSINSAEKFKRGMIYDNMNIAKALKTKNRLAGELSKVRSTITKYNSQLVNAADKVDINAALEKHKTLTNSLVKLKARISISNKNVQEKIYLLSELKNFVIDYNLQYGTKYTISKTKEKLVNTLLSLYNL